MSLIEYLQYKSPGSRIDENVPYYYAVLTSVAKDSDLENIRETLIELGSSFELTLYNQTAILQALETTCSMQTLAMLRALIHDLSECLVDNMHLILKIIYRCYDRGVSTSNRGLESEAVDLLRSTVKAFRGEFMNSTMHDIRELISMVLDTEGANAMVKGIGVGYILKEDYEPEKAMESIQDMDDEIVEAAFITFCWGGCKDVPSKQIGKYANYAISKIETDPRWLGILKASVSAQDVRRLPLVVSIFKCVCNKVFRLVKEGRAQELIETYLDVLFTVLDNSFSNARNIKKDKKKSIKAIKLETQGRKNVEIDLAKATIVLLNGIREKRPDFIQAMTDKSRILLPVLEVFANYKLASNGIGTKFTYINIITDDNIMPFLRLIVSHKMVFTMDLVNELLKTKYSEDKFYVLLLMIRDLIPSHVGDVIKSSMDSLTRSFELTRLDDGMFTRIFLLYSFNMPIQITMQGTDIYEYANGGIAFLKELDTLQRLVFFLMMARSPDNITTNYSQDILQFNELYPFINVLIDKIDVGEGSKFDKLYSVIVYNIRNCRASAFIYEHIYASMITCSPEEFKDIFRLFHYSICCETALTVTTLSRVKLLLEQNTTDKYSLLLVPFALSTMSATWDVIPFTKILEQEDVELFVDFILKIYFTGPEPDTNASEETRADEPMYLFPYRDFQLGNEEVRDVIDRRAYYNMMCWPQWDENIDNNNPYFASVLCSQTLISDLVCLPFVTNFISYLIQNMKVVSPLFVSDVHLVYDTLMELLDHTLSKTQDIELKSFAVSKDTIFRIFYLLLTFDSIKPKLLKKKALSGEEINRMCSKLVKLLYSNTNSRKTKVALMQFKIGTGKDKIYICGDMKILIIGFICSLNANLRPFASNLVDIYKTPTEVHRIVFDTRVLNIDNSETMVDQRKDYKFVPVEELEFINTIIDSMGYKDLNLISFLNVKNDVASDKKGEQKHGRNKGKNSKKKDRHTSDIITKELEAQNNTTSSTNISESSNAALRVNSLDYPYVVGILIPILYSHLMNKKLSDSDFSTIVSYIAGQQDFGNESTNVNENVIVILQQIYQQIASRYAASLDLFKGEPYPNRVFSGYLRGITRLFNTLPSIFNILYVTEGNYKSLEFTVKTLINVLIDSIQLGDEMSTYARLFEKSLERYKQQCLILLQKIVESYSDCLSLEFYDGLWPVFHFMLDDEMIEGQYLCFYQLNVLYLLSSHIKDVSSFLGYLDGKTNSDTFYCVIISSCFKNIRAFQQKNVDEPTLAPQQDITQIQGNICMCLEMLHNYPFKAGIPDNLEELVLSLIETFERIKRNSISRKQRDIKTALINLLVYVMKFLPSKQDCKTKDSLPMLIKFSLLPMMTGAEQELITKSLISYIDETDVNNTSLIIECTKITRQIFISESEPDAKIWYLMMTIMLFEKCSFNETVACAMGTEYAHPNPTRLDFYGVLTGLLSMGDTEGFTNYDTRNNAVNNLTARSESFDIKEYYVDRFYIRREKDEEIDLATTQNTDNLLDDTFLLIHHLSTYWHYATKKSLQPENKIFDVYSNSLYGSALAVVLNLICPFITKENFSMKILFRTVIENMMNIYNTDGPITETKFIRTGVQDPMKIYTYEHESPDDFKALFLDIVRVPHIDTVIMKFFHKYFNSNARTLNELCKETVETKSFLRRGGKYSGNRGEASDSVAFDVAKPIDTKYIETLLLKIETTTEDILNCVSLIIPSDAKRYKNIVNHRETDDEISPLLENVQHEGIVPIINSTQDEINVDLYLVLSKLLSYDQEKTRGDLFVNTANNFETCKESLSRVVKTIGNCTSNKRVKIRIVEDPFVGNFVVPLCLLQMTQSSFRKNSSSVEIKPTTLSVSSDGKLLTPESALLSASLPFLPPSYLEFIIKSTASSKSGFNNAFQSASDIALLPAMITAVDIWKKRVNIDVVAQNYSDLSKWGITPQPQNLEIECHLLVILPYKKDDVKKNEAYYSSIINFRATAMTILRRTLKYQCEIIAECTNAFSKKDSSSLKYKLSGSKGVKLCRSIQIIIDSLSTLLTIDVAALLETYSDKGYEEQNKVFGDAQKQRISYIREMLALFIPMVSNPISHVRQMARQTLGKSIVSGASILADIECHSNVKSAGCPLHRALSSLLMMVYIGIMDSCSSSSGSVGSASTLNSTQKLVKGDDQSSYVNQLKFSLYQRRQKSVAYTVWAVMNSVKVSIITNIQNDEKMQDKNHGLLAHCSCNGLCLSAILYSSGINHIDTNVILEENAEKKKRILTNAISPVYVGTSNTNQVASLSRCILFLMLRDTLGTLSERYLFRSRSKHELGNNDKADIFHSGMKLAILLGSETEWGNDRYEKLVDLLPLPLPIVGAVLDIPLFNKSTGWVTRKAKGTNPSSQVIRGNKSGKLENQTMVANYKCGPVNIENICTLSSCVVFILRMALNLYLNDKDEQVLTFTDNAVGRINSNILSNGATLSKGSDINDVTNGTFNTMPPYTTGGVIGGLLIDLARGIEKNGLIQSSKEISPSMWDLIQWLESLEEECRDINVRFKSLEKRLKEEKDREIYDVIAHGSVGGRKANNLTDEVLGTLKNTSHSNTHVTSMSYAHMSREDIVKIQPRPNMEKGGYANISEASVNIAIFTLVKCTVPLGELFFVSCCSALTPILCKRLNAYINTRLTNTTDVDLVKNIIRKTFTIMHLLDIALSAQTNDSILEIDFKKQASPLLSADPFIHTAALEMACKIRTPLVEMANVESLKGPCRSLPHFVVSAKRWLEQMEPENMESEAVEQCVNIRKYCRRIVYTIAAAISRHIPGSAAALSVSSLSGAQRGTVLSVVGNNVKKSGIIRGNTGVLALSLLCNKNVFNWNGDCEWSPQYMVIAVSQNSRVVRTVAENILDSLSSCISGLSNDERVYRVLYQRVKVARFKNMEAYDKEEMAIIEKSVLMLPTVLTSIVTYGTAHTDEKTQGLMNLISKTCMEWAAWEDLSTTTDKQGNRMSNRQLLIEAALKLLINGIGDSTSRNEGPIRVFNPTVCLSAFKLLDSLLSLVSYLALCSKHERLPKWTYGFLEPERVRILILACIAAYNNSSEIQNELVSGEGSNQVVIDKIKLAACQMLVTIYESGCVEATVDGKDTSLLSMSHALIAPLVGIITRANNLVKTVLNEASESDDKEINEEIIQERVKIIKQATSALAVLHGFLITLEQSDTGKERGIAFINSRSLRAFVQDVFTNLMIAETVVRGNVQYENEYCKQISKPQLNLWEFLFRTCHFMKFLCGLDEDKTRFSSYFKMREPLLACLVDALSNKFVISGDLRKNHRVVSLDTITTLLRHNSQWLRLLGLEMAYYLFEHCMEESDSLVLETLSAQAVVKYICATYDSIGYFVIESDTAQVYHKSFLDFLFRNIETINRSYGYAQAMEPPATIKDVWSSDAAADGCDKNIIALLLTNFMRAYGNVIFAIRGAGNHNVKEVKPGIIRSLKTLLPIALHYLTAEDRELSISLTSDEPLFSLRMRCAPFCSFIIYNIAGLYDMFKEKAPAVSAAVRKTSMNARETLNSLARKYYDAIAFARESPLLWEASRQSYQPRE